MESITVPASLESLARISDFVTDATARAGLDDHAAWQVQGFAQANLLPDEDSDEFPVMGATDCCPEDVTDEQCEEALEKLAGTKKTGMKAIPPEVWQTLLAVAMKLLDKWLSK